MFHLSEIRMIVGSFLVFNVLYSVQTKTTASYKNIASRLGAFGVFSKGMLDQVVDQYRSMGIMNASNKDNLY